MSSFRTIEKVVTFIAGEGLDFRKKKHRQKLNNGGTIL